MANEQIELQDIPDVEVLSTGTWRGSKTVTITQSMLHDMERAFAMLQDKVTGFRPPLKLGHAEAQAFIRQSNGSGAPALGWVSSLRVSGDKLLATFASVPSTLVDLIKQRLYNSVSIEFRDQIDFNGVVFPNVLTAVAILGAELPAVKGLKDLASSLLADDKTEVIALSAKDDEGIMTDKTNPSYSQDQVDALVAAAVAKEATRLAEVHAAALVAEQGKTAAALAEVKAVGDKLVVADTALNTFRADTAKAQIVEKVDAAIKSGRATPAEKDGLVAFAQSLDTKATIKFGEGDKAKSMSSLDAWFEQLGKRPVVVKFSEQSRTTGDGEGDGLKADEVVLTRAKAKVTDKIGLSEAVQIVLSEDPELKARYVAGA